MLGAFASGALICVPALQGCGAADHKEGSTQATSAMAPEPAREASAAPEETSSELADDPSIWLQSAALVGHGDFRFPGKSTSELEYATHVAGGGTVLDIRPGLIIRQPGSSTVPPTAFVNVVISLTDPVLSTEYFPGTGELLVALPVDYGDTDVAREVLRDARIDPSELATFPTSELADVEYTYDDGLLAEAYETRVDDAIQEIIDRSQSSTGERVILFLRSYEQDRRDLEVRARNGDEEARAVMETLHDRPGEYYLINPGALLQVDPDGIVHPFSVGTFDELAGLTYDAAIASMAKIVAGAAT